MKKRIAFIFASIILLLSILEGSTVSTAAPVNECDFLINGIIAHEMGVPADSVDSALLQTWANEVLPGKINGSGEWYTMALSHLSPDTDLNAVKAALISGPVSDVKASAITRLKTSLSLLACSDFSNPYIENTALSWYSENGLMDYIFGLHLMNNQSFEGAPDYSEVFEKILAYRRNDGGFSLFGEYGDVDVTAMLLQALASGPLLSIATERGITEQALNFLSLAQEPSGDYKSFGTANPESTAQVIMALTSLGIDPLSDERFIKEGNLLDGLEKYRLEDGSFSHFYQGDSNGNATVQAFYSLVALKKFYEGQQFFYIWKKAESEPAPTITPGPTITPLPTNVPDILTTPLPTAVPSVTAFPGSTEGPTGFFVSHGLPMIIASAFILVFFIVLLLLKKLNRQNLLFLLLLWIALLIIAAFIKISPASTGLPEDAPITAGPASGDGSPYGTVTISVTCHTIKDKNSDFVPKNGIIIPDTDVYITEGTDVFDVLSAVCMRKGINCDAQSTGTVYVRGINNIYERDFGNLSGWMYFVNGVAPQVDCGSYILKPGDKIEWKYTANIGDDLK